MHVFDFYHKYDKWKQWGGQAPALTDNRCYAKEIRRAQVKPGAKILEFGFGSGAFLDWAGLQGFYVHGVDLQSELVESARTRGHHVSQGETLAVAAGDGVRFDAIVAFDVLEHLSLDDVFDFFRTANQLLTPEGVVIAGFPNGSSPFGRDYQHGDLTHQTILNHRRMEHIGFNTGFELVGVYNAARSLNGSRPWLFPVRIAFACVRRTIEHLLGLMYYHGRIPLDPSMTVVLRRRLDAADLHPTDRDHGGD